LLPGGVEFPLPSKLEALQALRKIRRVSAPCSCIVAAGNRYADAADMFGFFSSRLGCLGSLVVSIIGTVLLTLLMRGCSGTSW